MGLKPISQIKVDLGLEPNGRVEKQFTQSCYNHMDKYVPKREGNLRTIVSISSNLITYEMPYAEYQYKGQREDGTHKVRRYTTSGTGPYWDKRMVSAEIQDVIDEVNDYIERND